MAVAEHVMREGTTGLATAQSHSHSEHEEVDVKPANNRGPPLTSAGGTTSTLRKGQSASVNAYRSIGCHGNMPHRTYVQ